MTVLLLNSNLCLVPVVPCFTWLMHNKCLITQCLEKCCEAQTLVCTPALHVCAFCMSGRNAHLLYRYVRARAALPHEGKPHGSHALTHIVNTPALYQPPPPTPLPPSPPSRNPSQS